MVLLIKKLQIKILTFINYKNLHLFLNKRNLFFLNLLNENYFLLIIFILIIIKLKLKKKFILYIYM